MKSVFRGSDISGSVLYPLHLPPLRVEKIKAADGLIAGLPSAIGDSVELVAQLGSRIREVHKIRLSWYDALRAMADRTDVASARPGP